MAEVFIPYNLRKFTNGESRLSIPATTLRELIDSLEAMYPGIKAELVEGDRLRPGLAAVCGYAPTRKGLMQELEPDMEVHFLPAIAGGSSG